MIRVLKTNEQRFWDWFSKNSENYLHFENNREQLFQTLKTELEKIDSNLTFEFSKLSEDGTREFVISADGIKSSFPTVINLVNNAPPLKNWKIIALRQPHKEVTIVNFQNLNIALKDVFFRYTKDNTKIDIELHMPGFYESPEWRAITFVLLDTVLGEYNAETYLGRITKKTLTENELGTLIPIINLPQIILACETVN